MKTIRLIKTTCVRPARGTERLGVLFANTFAASLGTGAAGAGAVAGLGAISVVGAPVAAAAGATAGICAFASALTGFGSYIATAADENRDPDQLYIKVDNKKVWPGHTGYIEMKSKQQIGLEYTFNFSNQCKITLMEYDWGSADDDMGSLIIKDNIPAGPYSVTIISKEEDSEYILEFEVK